MSALSSFHMGLIARLPCVICARFEATGLPVELHHVAEGSGKRSDFAVAPLCGDKTDGGHHRGAVGFHGPQGTRWFISFYKVPWQKEEGLLVWTAEELAKFLRRDMSVLTVRERR